MEVKLKDGMYVRSAKDATTSKHVTAGKLYKVSKVDNRGIPSFYITGDDGNSVYCLAYRCAHLNYDKWEILSSKLNLFNRLSLVDKKYYYYLLHLFAGISLGYLLFA